MLRYAFRRALWAIPTLFGISLVVFFVTTLIPDPNGDEGLDSPALLARDPARFDAVAEERRERFLDVPAFFNTHPNDVRIRVEDAMRHIIVDDAQATVGAHELAHLGGAALPYVLPQLDRLGPAERARVAVALAPIAERMGEPSPEKLRNADAAVIFWSHFWEDRSLDFTEPAVHRAVHRLIIHSTDLREKDLIAVDTFALHELIPAMTTVDDPDALRMLAMLASHATGRRGEIPADASEDDRARIVAEWQAWWRVNRADYTAFDGLQRVASAITETRYGRWVLSAATGRLGTSVRDGTPIYDKLRAKAPITLLLTLLALLVSYAVAVPLGVLSAWFRGRPVDVTLAVVLFAMYSFPTFWAAQLLAQTFAVAPHATLDAMQALGASGIATLYPHLIAPVCALAVGSFATLSRYQRAATLDVIGQDYVRAARAKGASPLRLLVVHALRNSMIPTVTLAGLQFPALLGGAFVVEEIFGVPGMGYETLRAVEARDSAWLVATMLLTALVTTVALITSDVAYGILDPRVRDTIVKRRGA